MTVRFGELRIIFRDESKFNLIGYGRKIVWRRINTEFNSANFSNYQILGWICDGRSAYEPMMLEN